MRKKRLIIQEEEQSRLSSRNKEINLEEEISTTKIAKEIQEAGPNYSKIFETLNTPKTVYEVTNREFYNNLNDLREKAARGEITPQEESFIQRLRDKFESFQENPEYLTNTDKNDYVRRSINIIDRISTYKVKD